VLRGGVGATVAALAGVSASACSPSGAPTRSPEGTGLSSPEPSVDSTGTAGASKLLAYFSRPGENYYYGGRTNLEVGNTEMLATMISGVVWSGATCTASRP
jgi:hypothetical protein